MAFEVLRETIKTKLESITEIEKVYDYPTEDLNGYPAVIVRAIGNESDYQTTAENERHYVFELYSYYLSDPNNRRKARRAIESLVDEILDAFDKDEYLSGITLPSGKIMLGIIPTLSEIIDLEKYVEATIRLTIKISVNIT